MANKLITIKELSEIIQVKEKTLYQWANLGQIPHVKLHGCLRFRLDHIEKWIESCTKQPWSSYNPVTQARGPGKRGEG